MREKDEKYTALYKTQDKILDIVAKEKLGFYLTGGTALQRFHFDSYRYSDDLLRYYKHIERKSYQISQKLIISANRILDSRLFDES